jgi:hypothetical protein
VKTTLFTGAVSGVSALATVVAGFALSTALGDTSGVATDAAAGVTTGGMMTWREAFRWGAGALGGGALAMSVLAKTYSGRRIRRSGGGDEEVDDEETAAPLLASSSAGGGASSSDGSADVGRRGIKRGGTQGGTQAAAAMIASDGYDGDWDGDDEKEEEEEDEGAGDVTYALNWSVNRLRGSSQLMGFTLAQGCSWCVYEMLVFFPLIGGGLGAS